MTKKYMKVGFVFAAVAIALATVSCASAGPSQAASAWAGVYEVRDMPASTPAGILNMDITLNEDCTFELAFWVDPEMVTTESGSFTWVDETEGILELGLENPESPLRLHQVDGNNLRHLMPSGEAFEADGHILTRR